MVEFLFRSSRSSLTPGLSTQPAPRRFTLEAALDLLTAHLVVALIALVGIGGATRVMQAGLACPDWPLCYGTLLPGRQMNLKVFLEWFHRLDAFLVGLALLVLAAMVVLRRRRLPGWLPWATGLALALVVFQGGLGALTVLGLLAASSVTAHLLTALLLVFLVSGMHQALPFNQAADLQPAGFEAPSTAEAAESALCSAGSTAQSGASTSESPDQQLPAWWIPLLASSTLVLLGQCGLGAAMASRWAASLCLNGGQGCHWLLLHRLAAWGALLALVLPAVLAQLALPARQRTIRRLALAAALLAPVQLLLGLFTLRLQLNQPLLTVAHQLLAALLVALLGALWGRSLAVTALPSRAVPLPPPLEMAHG